MRTAVDEVEFDRLSSMCVKPLKQVKRSFTHIKIRGGLHSIRELKDYASLHSIRELKDYASLHSIRELKDYASLHSIRELKDHAIRMRVGGKTIILGV